MENSLLDKLPDDILNIIFRYIKPDYKYFISKYYFDKYYFLRFGFLNNKIEFQYQKYLLQKSYFCITNFKYIKFLIKNDLNFILKIIIYNKLYNDKSNYILKKPIIFENTKYINFIDFCYLLSLKFNSSKISTYIKRIIIEYNVKVSKKTVTYTTNNSNKSKNTNNNNKNGKNNKIKNKNFLWIF